MSFGFSVGDFLSAAILIKDITKCLKVSGGSASEYQELMLELNGLQSALAKIEHLKGSAEQMQTIDSIKVVALSCKYALSNFLEKLKTYDKSLEYGKTRGWVVDSAKKIKWKLAMNTDVQNLRTYLMVHTSNLKIMLSTAELTTAWMAANQAEHNHEALERRFDKARSAIINVQAGVTSLEKEQKGQENKKIVAWLSTLNFLTTQNDIFNRRQVGSGEWMLEADLFKEWLAGTNRTLWCPGIPGAGKTILTSIIINYLEQIFDFDNVGLAYVYCNYKELRDQTATNLVASLLQQLVQQQSNIPSGIISLYRIHTEKRTRPSLAEYSSSLQSIVHDFSKVFIIIDALDEYIEKDGTRDKFLTEIKKLLPDIHFLVTSRWVPNIEREFEESIKLEIRASDEDVARYLKARIGKEARLKRHVKEDPIMQDAIINTIAKNSQGMFLLAQLHMDSLAKKPHRKAVRLALENLPKELDDTYDEAMERIKSQDKDYVDLAHQTLSWISYAIRPLTVEEIRHALAVEPKKTSIDEETLIDEDLLVSVCAGMVTVDQESSIIRLVHYTTQEYFERTRLQHFPNAQQEIAATCLTYLSFDAFREGYCSADEILENKLQQNPLFDYAARNWGKHACGKAEKNVRDLALDFLIDNLKVSGASQVLLDSEYRYSGYSQRPPKRFHGMHFVAYFGLRDTMRLLVEREAVEVDSMDSHGRMPLSYAAENGHDAVVKLLLLEKAVDVDSKNSYGWTPLSYAAKNGHEAVVKLLLLENAVDVDSKDSNGRTPLSWAAKNGHEAVVKLLLLEKAIEVDSKDSYGWTPLSYAAKNGHEAVVKLLLLEKAVDVDSKDSYGRTPLSFAAKNGHEAVVQQLLLEKAIDVNSKDSYGQTPLSWAAENGHDAVVKLLLLEKAVDVNSKNSYGRTPLSYAAKNGHEAVVKLLLLEKAVDVNSKDSYGWTPLSWAAKNGHEAVVKLLLLEKAIDVNSKDKYGWTPLSYAAKNGHEAVVKLLLLEKAIDVDSKDSNGRTPLLYAAKNGREAVAKLLLLEKAVDVDSKDDYDRTPLSYAAGNGHDAVVKLLLLEKAVDVDSKNSYGGTPLSYAAKNGHEAVVKLLLLEKAVDVDSKDSYGWTPLSWAAKNGHEAVVKLLLLEKAVDADSKDSSGGTPLSYAAGNGHEAVVKLLLLEKAVDVGSKDSSGRTPLSFAAKNGHEAVVKLLESKTQ